VTKHFSLNAWHDYYGGEFTVIRVRLDWYRNLDACWIALDAGLLGGHVSLTFWPRGKFPHWAELGREHGEAGE
jgi:hypothetical protein